MQIFQALFILGNTCCDNKEIYCVFIGYIPFELLQKFSML